MAKIFLSYRFTGEDLNELEQLLSSMKHSLEGTKNVVTCSFFLESFFREQHFTTDQIYEYMLKEQGKCDTFMALLKSDEKSKGMLLESEQAQQLGQRYVVVYKRGIYIAQFHTHAHQLIEYSDHSELQERLKSFS